MSATHSYPVILPKPTYKFLLNRQVSYKPPPSVVQFTGAPAELTIVRMTFRGSTGAYKVEDYTGNVLCERNNLKGDVWVLRPGSVLTANNLWFYYTDRIPLDNTAIKIRFDDTMSVVKIWWKSEQPHNQIYYCHEGAILRRFGYDVIHRGDLAQVWLIERGREFTLIGDVEHYVINTASQLES